MAQLSVVESRSPSWVVPIEGVKRAHVCKDKSTGMPGFRCRVFTKVQASEHAGNAWVLDGKTGETAWCHNEGKWYLCIAWRPDGEKVAVGCEDGSALVFAASSGNADLHLPHHLRVTSVAWTPDGSKLASGCADKVLRIFDALSGILEWKQVHRGAVRSIHWHPNGYQFASGSSDHCLRVFDTSAGQDDVIEEVHGDGLNSVAWSPDGSKLATGCADRFLIVFDMTTRLMPRLHKLKHRDGVRSVSWRADGLKLATACNDKCAHVFDASTGNADWQFRHGASVSCVAWKPSSRLLATASADKCARVFNTISGTQVLLVRYENQLSCIAWQLGVAASPEDVVAEEEELAPVRGTVCLIMGPPGGGKGTISKKIIEDFGFHHISTGDILRAQIRKGTALGLKAQRYMKSGGLVPDALMVEMVLEEARRARGDRILLDGFPRTEPQAQELDKSMQVHLALNLSVPIEEIVRRTSNRWLHPASGRTYAYDYNPPKIRGKDDETGEPLIQRDDDKPDAVRRRLVAYNTMTRPVLTHYRKQGVLKEFDGADQPSLLAQDRRSDAIYASLSIYVGSQLGENSCSSSGAVKKMVPSLIPFAEYYKQNMVPCPRQWWGTFYGRFAFSAPSTASGDKTAPRSDVGAIAAGGAETASVKNTINALMPFRPYYAANFMVAPPRIWETLYSTFRASSDTSGVLPTNKEGFALRPFRAYYKQNLRSCPQRCWDAVYEDFSKRSQS